MVKLEGINRNIVVATVGTFDLFHPGHVNILQMCRQVAGEYGKVVVGINSDDFVERYKKTRPIMDFSERSRLVETCIFVNQTYRNDSEDLRPALIEQEVKVLLIGSDWARRDYYKQIGADQDWFDHYNISLMYVPYTSGVSTTNIKERITDVHCSSH